MLLAITVFMLYFFQGHGQAYVPDEVTAIKIAEAVWLPIYGERIYTEKPFKANLVGDSVWVVEGTKGFSGSKINPATGHMEYTIISGGVFTAEIRKSDCKVLRVYHPK